MVAFSVVAQGGTVPAVARRLKIPMTVAEVEPWSAVADLDLPEDAWIIIVIRGGQLVPVQASTMLRAGDEVLVLASDEQSGQLTSLFTQPRTGA